MSTIMHNHSWMFQDTDHKRVIAIDKGWGYLTFSVAEHYPTLQEVKITLTPEEFVNLAHFIFDTMYALTTSEQRGETEIE